MRLAREYGALSFFGQDICQFNRQALLDYLQALQGNVPCLLEALDGQAKNVLYGLFHDASLHGQDFDKYF